MLLRSIFIELVMKLLNWILTTYIYIKSVFFKVLKIYTITESGEKKCLYNKYLLAKIYIHMYNYFNYIPIYGKCINDYCKKIINNNKNSLIKIETYEKGNIRDIIFHNKNMLQIVNTINHLKHDINETIMNKKYIISDIVLIDNLNQTTISLKKLLDHYSDKSKKYDHQIKNLLNLKKIQHSENYTLQIKYIYLLKYNIKTYILKDIYDWHICDIYNFS